jgi:hypothetical protein
MSYAPAMREYGARRQIGEPAMATLWRGDRGAGGNVDAGHRGASGAEDGEGKVGGWMVAERGEQGDRKAGWGNVGRGGATCMAPMRGDRGEG